MVTAQGSSRNIPKGTIMSATEGQITGAGLQVVAAYQKVDPAAGLGVAHTVAAGPGAGLTAVVEVAVGHAAAAEVEVAAGHTPEGAHTVDHQKKNQNE